MAISPAVSQRRVAKPFALLLRLGAAAGRGLRRAARATWPALRVAGGLVPLTPLGMFALPLLLLVAWVYGGEHPDLIVQSLYIGGLAMILLCFLLVLATMGRLLLARKPAAEGALVLEAGTPLRTGFRLGRFSRNPLVRIAVAWEEFAAVRAELLPAPGGTEEQATAAARDYQDSILRCFTVSDVFGLTRLAIRRRFVQVVRCLPEVSATPQFTLPVQYQPGDQIGHPEGQPVGDFVEMRRYVAGDPLKLILWKAYARTGKVLVRAPERAVNPTTKTLAYLVAGPGDEPSAGIARSALASRALGTEVTFSADGAAHPVTSPSEAIDQILFSAREAHNGGTGLDRFLGQGESAGTAACVLFIPGRRGAWLAHTVAALRAHRGPFQAVLGLDGPPLPDQRWPWWLRLFLRPLAEKQPRAAEIREIRNAFRQAACEVAVVDRHSGSVCWQDNGEG
ncbi:MAG: DUF58 domain-containing protein [Thermoguttaceae bacterium]|jgi:uncharacterized protein (DUF58 family)